MAGLSSRSPKPERSVCSLSTPFPAHSPGHLLRLVLHRIGRVSGGVSGHGERSASRCGTVSIPACAPHYRLAWSGFHLSARTSPLPQSAILDNGGIALREICAHSHTHTFGIVAQAGCAESSRRRLRQEATPCSPYICPNPPDTALYWNVCGPCWCSGHDACLRSARGRTADHRRENDDALRTG